MFLYIGGETSGESRFSNLETGGEAIYSSKLALLTVSSGSHSNSHASDERIRSHSRKPILRRKLSVQLQHNRRAYLFYDGTKFVIFNLFFCNSSKTLTISRYSDCRQCLFCSKCCVPWR